MKHIMNLTKSEKIILIILSILFFAGSVKLYIKNTRPLKELTVEKTAVKEELTLAEVENLISENRKININSATASELEKIPGIGEVTAQSIVEYRAVNGNFYSKEDLLEIPGIGEKKLEKIQEYIKFE